MMDLDLLCALQWPAMVVTLAGAWLVASKSEKLRAWGFWANLASNALWIGWGLYTSSWALVVLQVGLIAMNLRGATKNDTSAA